MRFKIYKSSVLATLVSIIGAVTCYGGILALFEKEFVAGILCIAIGIVIQAAAGNIAENTAFKCSAKVTRIESLRVSIPWRYSCIIRIPVKRP